MRIIWHLTVSSYVPLKWFWKICDEVCYVSLLGDPRADQSALLSLCLTLLLPAILCLLIKEHLRKLYYYND